MCGFAQDDGYVRGVAAAAQNPPSTLSSFTTNKVYPNGYIAVGYLLFLQEQISSSVPDVPIPVPVSRVNAYSGGVLARALPEGLRYLST
jgi:hypothetical protein